jgi:hypothetical protein
MIHDGLQNTYALCIKGKRVVVAPRREGSMPTQVTKKSMNLLSMAQFWRRWRKVAWCTLMECEVITRGDVSVEL